MLHNGLGQYPVALAAARRACEHEDLGFYGWSLAELVEAGARAGAPDEAAAALAQLAERTGVAGRTGHSGIAGPLTRVARATASEADALYREAIERLGRSRIARPPRPCAAARTASGCGASSGASTRASSSAPAHETFSRIGAEAFAERAGRELAATGETVPRRTAETRDHLTAQEAQIARLAAAGHTNPEIGAQLFISPRTVEYHLRKVFTKLDIGSRRELRGALPEDAHTLALI